MESWTEIKIAVNAKDIDRAGDIANVVVPYGIILRTTLLLSRKCRRLHTLTL